MTDTARQDVTAVWEDLAQPGARIMYLVLDGGGGLPHPRTGQSALQAARTPHLDALAAESSCGLLELVGPGITPGSGPGHLALFGYDPLTHRLGRGVLSALGIDFPLEEGDVSARVNFATLDADGTVVDRRAGRIDTDRNRELCAAIGDDLALDFDGEVFLETVSEHRAVLVLRGEDLGGEVADTDPQATGMAPLDPRGFDEPSRRTARLVGEILGQARERLRDRERANSLLLRGFERFSPLPTLEDRFGLRGLCLARYPMYRGLSRLLGMELADPASDEAGAFEGLRAAWGGEHDFHFLHVKGTDSTGEDADFDAKVAVVEEVDGLLPRLLDLEPEVLVVTSDHSTPASMGRHSWHPVPVLLRSRWARRDAVARFDETACVHGALGLRPGVHLMGLALASAGRLAKFGA